MHAACQWQVIALTWHKLKNPGIIDWLAWLTLDGGEN